MIWFNGFPFLDKKEEHTFGVPVSRVMTSDMRLLTTAGLDLKALEGLLRESKYQGFPVVEEGRSKVLVGYIGRTELRYAIDRAKREHAVSPHARCFFTPPSSTTSATAATAGPAVTFDTLPSTAGQMSIDFSRFVDPTPLAVHPRLPLETVMELFKKMGPRVILIEHRGRLTGLVTVKDCLKYQFKVEAGEHVRDDSALEERQERLWTLIQQVADWLAHKASAYSAGRIRLGSMSNASASPIYRTPASPASRGDILEGTEDDDAAVELDNR